MGTLRYLVTWILMLAVVVFAQKRPSSNPNGGLRSECLGNVLRLSLDKALAVGNQLEIDAISGSKIIPLTPRLAAQCGYSMESDPLGNTKVFASLMGCYVDNEEDVTFNLGMRLRMLGDLQGQQDSYDVTKMCSYTKWASHEILCDRNYMEVSTHVVRPLAEAKTVEGQEQAIDAPSSNIWKMTFYTPEEKIMLLREAQQAGYGAMSTPSRLVMRSPYNTAETYSEDVAGVPMEVFSVSSYYRADWGKTLVDSTAACPTGGVDFTEDVITWHVPRHISPMITSNIKILELHMGIDGQKLDKTRMAARGYSLSATESHVVITIPVGSPDGYYKSHAPDYQYHITFTVEPMLEMLWRAEDQAETRYKVLFPITTPLMPRPPQVADNTVPEQRVFNVVLGTFLYDVELVNITFSTGVLSVAECNARGFNVQEHRFSNGSKTFSLKVPFSDDVVLKQNPEPVVTVYFLSLIYGLLILPEQTPFSHPAELEASLQDVVLPTITGSCDQENFYVIVKYGNQGHNFQTIVGVSDLTPELAEAYGLTENSTHFSLVMHFAAPDTVFELVRPSSVRGRIDLLLWDPENKWKLDDFSLACDFHLPTTECYSNGTMTALTVKVESTRNLVPSQLTLRDESCKPVFSNDRFAYFSFHVDTCGTTRTFFDNVMLYENDITLHHDSPGKGSKRVSPVDPEFRHTVSCYYLLNDTETMVFHTKPRDMQPIAEVGEGQLVVQMRLAQDVSYDLFYQAEDYPVVKYLRQPLYFEVELIQSTDPQIEMVLENCWATLHEDRTSLPSWDIIVDSCENLDDRYLTVFHPVVPDARVAIPTHVKRFSVKMFTFTRDEAVLKDQIFVHCDAVICDTNNPTDGICSGQCVNPTNMSSAKPQRITGLKRGRRGADSIQHQKFQSSSGPIILSDPQ